MYILNITLKTNKKFNNLRDILYMYMYTIYKLNNICFVTIYKLNIIYILYYIIINKIYYNIDLNKFEYFYKNIQISLITSKLSLAYIAMIFVPISVYFNYVMLNDITATKYSNK